MNSPDRRRAARGEAQEWAEIASNTVCDECIIWPFARSGRGYGGLGGGTVHVAVCEMAHGPKPDDKDCAAHSCGVKLCVNPAHIRWATKLENEHDKIKHGTVPFGERHGNSKLTAFIVLEIRKDKRTNKQIAAWHNIHPRTVRRIRNGGSWDWLE